MIQNTKCPICRQKFTDHSELQEQICKIIMVKEFAGNCLGFDVEHWGEKTGKTCKNLVFSCTNDMLESKMVYL